jgi:hypothetical protein
MTEEKQKETKVNFSFLGALKFWLAFLLVALIGIFIVLALMVAFFAIFIQPILLDIIENIPQVPTLLVSFA